MSQSEALEALSRLERVIADAESLLSRCSYFRLYDTGPLTEPWAKNVILRLGEALKEESGLAALRRALSEREGQGNFRSAVDLVRSEIRIARRARLHVDADLLSRWDMELTEALDAPSATPADPAAPEPEEGGTV